MSAAGRGVPGPGCALIGRRQPERLGLRRCGRLVPSLGRLVAASPRGRLALRRSRATVGLRGSVPLPVGALVSIVAVVSAAARTGRPYRGIIAVLAGPFPLTLPAGSRPLTPGRRTIAPVTRNSVTPGRLTAHRLAITRITLGSNRAWPPTGTRTRARRRLPRPFGEVAVHLATVAAAAASRSRQAIGGLRRTSDQPGTGRLTRTSPPGPGGPDPGGPDPGRRGTGDVSCCPAGPDLPRCCFSEKLSAPEQNSDAESERREDTHGDRSVDQSQAGRGHSGHQHHHRRNGQKGAGPDHVRPPTTRRGVPGGWLPAVV